MTRVNWNRFRWVGTEHKWIQIVLRRKFFKRILKIVKVLDDQRHAANGYLNWVIPNVSHHNQKDIKVVCSVKKNLRSYFYLLFKYHIIWKKIKLSSQHIEYNDHLLFFLHHLEKFDNFYTPNPRQIKKMKRKKAKKNTRGVKKISAILFKWIFEYEHYIQTMFLRVNDSISFFFSFHFLKVYYFWIYYS